MKYLIILLLIPFVGFSQVSLSVPSGRYVYNQEEKVRLTADAVDRGDDINTSYFWSISRPDTLVWGWYTPLSEKWFNLDLCGDYRVRVVVYYRHKDYYTDPNRYRHLNERFESNDIRLKRNCINHQLDGNE